MAAHPLAPPLTDATAWRAGAAPRRCQHAVVSSTWSIVLGSALTLAGSVTGGYFSARAGRRERVWDIRRAAYSAWIAAISEAARLAERAQRAPTEDAMRVAEDALDAAVPFMVGLIVSGAPAVICAGAEEMNRLVRRVRRNETPYTEMQGTLRPVVELIRQDAAPRKLVRIRRPLLAARPSDTTL
jgi:hypothetical protein